MRVDEYCKAVIRAVRPDPTTQAVLWAIAFYVNRRTGATWVSLPTIAADTGLSLRTVYRRVAELRADSVFAVVTTPGRPNVYQFPVHPALSTAPDTRDTGTPDTGVTPPLTHQARTPVTRDTRNEITPSSLREPRRNQRARTRAERVS